MKRRARGPKHATKTRRPTRRTRPSTRKRPAVAPVASAGLGRDAAIAIVGIPPRAGQQLQGDRLDVCYRTTPARRGRERHHER
jgi:hypothetical protein